MDQPRWRPVALAIVAVSLLSSLPGARAHDCPGAFPPPVHHACITDPTFPPDCVDQLGAIGESPLPAGDEGYLGIASPVVDPLLRLQSAGAGNGRLYAVNPAANTVRVFSPSGLGVLSDIRVCYRPSALAQNADGSRVFVSCHASHAVGIIDTDQQLMVGLVQDRDGSGRPLLQEPMGMAVSGDTLYVASSQNNKIAVVDLLGESVARYIDLPGQDPRALAITDDGAYLIVANLLAGNRTEPELPELTNLGPLCSGVLQDPAAQAVYDEDSPTFMDTAHPDYALIAECYIREHRNGDSTETVVRNPERPDHDLVVIRLADEQVVFTTNTLADDPGTLNYGLAFDASGPRVYLATVHARNHLNSGFAHRPLVNRLVVFDFEPATGALQLAASNIKDLDSPYLNFCTHGSAEAATPYGVAVTPTAVLLTAAGSDRLVVTDKSGNITTTIPVGFGPKGIVVDGTTAWVYNSTGLSVSEVDLVSSASFEASLGPSQVPDTVRLGARLFHSAQFSANKTFACASCHPDGHLDGLLWRLNDEDKLRATMTLQEISETGAYHWDASKCNLVNILQDTVVNLFGTPAPTDCEMKVMIDFIDGLVRPHSPFRAVDDSMTPEAGLGGAVLHRAHFRDGDNNFLTCNDRDPDMTVEVKYLEAVGDPGNEVFAFDGGGGPVNNSAGNQACSAALCHVAPHMANGDLPVLKAVSTLGLWDRMVSRHDARTTRVKLIEALEVNRAFHGAPAIQPGDNFTGSVAAHGFLDLHFRQPEFDFDGNPATHGYVLTDALSQFLMEAEELQSGTVGLTVVLEHGAGGPFPLLDELESAADQGKITLLGVGTLGGLPTSLAWQPGGGTYLTEGAVSLTRADLLNALGRSDVMMLYGGLLPNQGSAPNPKLRAIVRDTAPYLCSEGFLEYPAATLVAETDVQLTLRGIDVVDGSRVLVNGEVTGAPLTGGGPDYSWTLPVAPAVASVATVQILGPTGLLSNDLPLPIVDPAVPPASVDGVQAAKTPDLLLSWESQFGVTGPGTHYDVYRGLLSDVASPGFDSGQCLSTPSTQIAEIVDDEIPPPDDGFYYVARAQNQLGVSSWGTAQRDVQINGSGNACSVLFP